jgi:site-specific recombinase XerC
MSRYVDSTRTPKSLTQDEQRRLLRVTGERRDGFRDHVIFSLALGTGLREHELLALNIGDVFDGPRCRRRLALRVFKRSNDDSSTQEVVLPDAVRTKLERYVANRKRDGEGLTDDTPLFMSRNHRRLSARQLREVFATWQERAGFDRRHNFHALRHTACTNLYRATRDIRLTQRFARHASILSTAIYTHPSDDDFVRSVTQLPC